MIPDHPIPTVDVIVTRGDSILLIERKNPPPGWALPGGFVDKGETVEAAAIREAKEETGLDVHLEALLSVYSHPSRDPRLHTLSVVFVARAEGEPAGGDDAERASFFPLDRLPSPLAFDHARIISDFIAWRTRGVRPAPEQR